MDATTLLAVFFMAGAASGAVVGIGLDRFISWWVSLDCEGDFS